MRVHVCVCVCVCVACVSMFDVYLCVHVLHVCVDVLCMGVRDSRMK